MNIWPELVKFLSSLLGALVGGSFVAWTAGYYSEKGKRLATKEDVNNVVEQVRAVTRETELIKAEISGGLWKQQWQLAQKRDSLVRLIDALENIRLQRTNVRQRSAEPERLQEAIEEFRRARALARLLFPSALIETMRDLIRSIIFAPDTTEGFMESQRRVAAVRDRVVELGKIELGITEQQAAAAAALPEQQ
jgi:hypothetical protein